MENKKKILFVIPALSNGGAERVVSKISSELAKHDYDVDILTFYNTDKDYFVNEKVFIHNLSKGKLEDYKKFGTLRRLKLIRRKIQEINPDEIFPFLDHVFIYVYIALFFTRFKKRVYYLMRNNPKFQGKKQRILTNFFNSFAKKIIVQNKGQKAYLSKRKQRKTTVIPNPIDEKYIKFEKKFNDTPKQLFSVGRLEKQKNYELALNSFAHITKDYPDLNYVIFGQGSLKEQLVDMCEKLNIKDKVEFRGFSSSFDEIYGQGDIFVMSSIYEGMPNALAEAIAVGVPVISTNCEFGPDDLVLDSQIGVLVNDFTTNSFTKELKNILDNYSYYVSKSDYRKKIIYNNYSLEKIVKLWIDIL